MALNKRRICRCRILSTLLIFALVSTSNCYEKTLRKMVRNQSKMVQRPFDDKSGILASEDRSYLNPLNLRSRGSGGRSVPVRTQISRAVRPAAAGKLRASSMDLAFGKTYSRNKLTQSETSQPIDLRSSKNVFSNGSKTPPPKIELFFFENHGDRGNGTSFEDSQSIRPMPSIFPPLDENVLQNIDTQTEVKKSIVIPSPNRRGEPEHDDNLLVKGIFRPHVASSITSNRIEYKSTEKMKSHFDNQKADYLMELSTTTLPSHGGHNMSAEGFQICASIKTTKSNIDAQKRFSEFDIEPSWISRKHYWNNIFNSRYEFLMRNPKWPALKVILIPRTHVYSIWKNTFEHYNNNSVNKILSNIVKKMNFYSNLTFTWNEISHLSNWWKTTTHKNRVAFQKFTKGGRLEITTGGWVESDEATTHIFGLVHNLIEGNFIFILYIFLVLYLVILSIWWEKYEKWKPKTLDNSCVVSGHQWLADNLNYSPSVAWLTSTVTHSPTMTYLLSVAGVTKLIFTNLHYSWEEYFAEYQISDFAWVQNWVSDAFFSSDLNKLLKRIGNERYPQHSVLSHYLQFNSDGFEACGPNRHLCATDFNFFKLSRLYDVNGNNIKDKSELLLEQYSKTGTLTPHNVIIAPIGGPHHFSSQEEFDYQYINYKKIAEFININSDIYKATIDFGTPKDYFKSIVEKNVNYPSLKGDFLNFADVESGTPAYWTGFFTTRPLLKMLLRRLQATMRSTEILFAFAVTGSRKDSLDIDISDIVTLMTRSRETVARLLDRNVISGTIPANVLRYVHEMILTTAKDCWLVQETLVSLLTTNKTRKHPYVRKYVYRNGEFISVFRTVNPGDSILVFNSLSHERYEIIELFSKIPNIGVIDHNKKDVTVQVNPVWKYGPKSIIVISKRFFKIVFAVLIPPLTIELFKIRETATSTFKIGTIYCVSCFVEEDTNIGQSLPFNIQPIERGDIQLENYKHRLLFDESSGFLKAVFEKESNTEKPLVIDFGAFASSNINSGVFLFNTNVTKPIRDILMPYRTGLKQKLFIIISGQLTTELTSVYGRLLHHTVKIFNLLNSPLSSAIFVESKIDLDVSPNNRDLELFMSIQTDINNGYPPEFHVDNNGFQFTPRTVNTSKRIESNVYPMTTLSYIQDRKQRLTVITDHAEGVTALHEGQLLLMLDRRVLYDDGRGTEEGLADSGASCQRHYILLENFIRNPIKDPVSHLKTVQLPSFRANYLSNTLNYDIDIFIIDRNETENCIYAILPFIKAKFPCDVALLNYRGILDRTSIKLSPTIATLMILHRQSFTCRINYEALVHCDVDPNFSLKNILRHAKSFSKTNLAGTNKGIRLNYVNIDNFPPMELLILRIHS